MPDCCIVKFQEKIKEKKKYLVDLHLYPLHARSLFFFCCCVGVIRVDCLR
jgi:hypothetical protein